METGAIILAAVVGFLGVGSAVLGFVAEETKLTRGDIATSTTRCVYPANPAFALGLVAALLLLVAQIIVSAVTGCCKPRGGGFSGSNRRIAVFLSVFSWIAAGIAEIFFVQGAVWNAPVTREAVKGCYYLKNGVFRRAAIMSIIATVLGIKSYLMFRAAAVPGTASAGEPMPHGIAMGHPAAPVYGHAPYGHYPPPPAQGYYPPPPAQGQGYGHFPPAAPDQKHTSSAV